MTRLTTNLGLIPRSGVLVPWEAKLPLVSSSWSINININTSINIKIIHITITLILILTNIIITINIVLIIIVIILTAAMTDLAVVLAGIGAGEIAVNRTCVPDDIFQALTRQVLKISSCSIIYLLPTCMLSSSSGSS